MGFLVDHWLDKREGSPRPTERPAEWGGGDQLPLIETTLQKSAHHWPRKDGTDYAGAREVGEAAHSTGE